MKNTFTIILILALAFGGSFTAEAQLVTITETHQIPAIGDTVHYVNANTFGFDPTGTGPVTNKLWDNSALLNAGTMYDFYFVDPTTVPVSLGRDSFPTATLARGESGATGYFYYQNTLNDINRLGWFGSNSNFGIYENGTFATEFHFPITAGQTVTSTYDGRYAPFNLGEDSVKITLGSVTINADMQGTLMLPTGTFTNALRVHVLENFHIVTYFIGVPALDNYVSDDYYYWFVDTILQPILISGTTTVDGTPQASVLRYQPVSSPTGISDVIVGASGLFPNPSNGKFTYVNNNLNLQGSNLEVFNVLGEKVYSTGVLNGGSKCEVNISNLEKGIYFVKITNNGRMIHSEKMIIK